MMFFKRYHFFMTSCVLKGCFFFFLLASVMSEVRLATLNVNGARDIRKRAMLNEVMKQKNLDVILLQETHSDVKNAADWAREFEGTSVLSHHTSTSAGVAVLFAKSFSPISYVVEEIMKGRLLKVRACFENSVFVFICVYAPTAAVERMVFFRHIMFYLAKLFF